jgi:hypothetical protein
MIHTQKMHKSHTYLWKKANGGRLVFHHFSWKFQKERLILCLLNDMSVSCGVLNVAYGTTVSSGVNILSFCSIPSSDPSSCVLSFIRLQIWRNKYWAQRQWYSQASASIYGLQTWRGIIMWIPARSESDGKGSKWRSRPTLSFVQFCNVEVIKPLV